MIDIHSHILPGIDDGAINIDDSIAIITELANQGVTEIIATPHYIEETVYTSPRTTNLKLLNQLKKALKAKKINVKLHLGNEIYISNNIFDLIASNEISNLSNSKYLLIELPLNDEFPNYQDIFMDLMSSGYHVILAHPERYTIAQKNYDVLNELYELGVLFQCNTGSILGRYGKGAQKTIQKLAKDKKIFTFGSDIHRCRNNDHIIDARKKFQKYFNDEELEILFTKNPRKIVSK